MRARFLLIAPALALSLVLAACGGGETEPQTGETTTEEMAGEEMSQPSSTDGPGQMASADQPGCWLRPDVTREAAAQRPSPRDSASIQLDAGMAKICYGAPSVRGREIFGGLEEWGEPWRGGADEATALHLTFPAEVAGVPVEPGTYSLIMIPDENQWEIIVNENAERWGIPITDEVRNQDVGSGTVTPEQTDEPVEMLRYTFERQGQGEALLVLEWADTRVPIPIVAQEG